MSGGPPDDLPHVEVVGEQGIVLHPTGAYNPQRFTDNQPTEPFTFPQQTWDQEGAGGLAGETPPMTEPASP